MDVNFDSTIFIEESVHELLFTLVLAALLTGDRLLAVPRLLVVDVQRAPGHPDVDPRHVHRHVLPRLHAEHLHRCSG